MVDTDELWLYWPIFRSDEYKSLIITDLIWLKTEEPNKLPRWNCRLHTWLCSNGCSACCCIQSPHNDPQCGTHNALTELPSVVEQGTEKKLHPAGKADSSKKVYNTISITTTTRFDQEWTKRKSEKNHSF